MIRKIFLPLFWAVIFSFIVLYPIFISIYVYLPLFIGFAGYMIIFGLEGNGLRYVFLPLFYLINLESNLSLPLLMAFFSALLYYLTLYDRVKILKRCPVCVGILSVLIIDIYYIATLLSYDFIFDASDVMMDSILFYSLVFDMVFVVLI